MFMVICMKFKVALKGKRRVSGGVKRICESLIFMARCSLIPGNEINKGFVNTNVCRLDREIKFFLSLNSHTYIAHIWICMPYYTHSLTHSHIHRGCPDVAPL